MTFVGGAPGGAPRICGGHVPPPPCIYAPVQYAIQVQIKEDLIGRFQLSKLVLF